MARRSHKSTDGLSAEAWRVMVAGFRGGKTYKAIQRDLDAMGEAVTLRVVESRGKEWEGEQRRRKAARETIQDLVAELKAGNVTAVEMVSALASDALMMEPGRFQGADAVKVQRLNMQAAAVKVRQDELRVKEREIALNEKRLELLEEREKRATAVAAEEDEKISPEERIRRIREIYGLKAGAA
jgi:hypothetical protein